MDLERGYSLQRNQDIYYTPGLSSKTALLPQDMARLYQLFDCLVFLNGSEGVGLPVWECMSSGIPIVYTNYLGPAEFVSRAQAGLPVDGSLQPELRTGYWRMIADVSSALKAIRALYFGRATGRSFGANGRRFTQRYQIRQQLEKWHKILQKFDGKPAFCGYGHLKPSDDLLEGAAGVVRHQAT